MSEGLLLTHAAATWFMVGLIWFVQVVHYPLFSSVGHEGWPVYEQRHQRLTTFVVLPPMLIELVTAVWIWVVALRGQVPSESWLSTIGLVLLAGIWCSTFLVQVRLHAKLSTEHSHAHLCWLVGTNWVRTALWSVRGAISLLFLAERMV